MVFENCWNIHNMPRPCGLRIGFENELEKWTHKPSHSKNAK
jgi:hypothetical protein